MPKWTIEIADQLAASCREAGPRLAEIFSTGLAQRLNVEVSDPEIVPAEQAADADLNSGLLIEFLTDGECIVAMLPSENGFEFAADDLQDEVTAARLQQFATSMHELMLGGELAPADTKISVVGNLGAEVRRRATAGHFARLDLVVSGETSTGVLRVLWPALPQKTDRSSPQEGEDAARDRDTKSPSATAARSSTDDSARRTTGARDSDRPSGPMPPYAQSLLKIRVPIRVTLAQTKLPLHRVLKLGPGTIIQFNKSCEETLTLEAGTQPIARGEAVKVGDKFGLWITSVASPSERFFVIQQRGRLKRVQ